MKEHLLADDYKHLLRWKLGKGYSSTTSGMKVAQLKQLWEVWKDMEVVDIELPPAAVEPSVPGPNKTALCGTDVKQKFEEAITAGDNLLDGEDSLELAEKFECITQQKGVNIELSNEEVEQSQHR